MKKTRFFHGKKSVFDGKNSIVEEKTPFLKRSE